MSGPFLSLRSPVARIGAGLAALLGAVLVAVVPGELAPAAARAGLAVALLAALAALARRPAVAAPSPSRLDVVARAALCASGRGREVGLALVEVDGRRLVVAFDEGGARLVADLGERVRERSP